MFLSEAELVSSVRLQKVNRGIGLMKCMRQGLDHIFFLTIIGNAGAGGNNALDRLGPDQHSAGSSLPWEYVALYDLTGYVVATVPAPAGYITSVAFGQVFKDVLNTMKTHGKLVPNKQNWIAADKPNEFTPIFRQSVWTEVAKIISVP